MQLIERAMMSTDFDVAKLDRLLDVKERWEKTEARKAFDAALSAAKAEIKPIVKRRKVDFTSQKGRTNYQYEDFALIAEDVDPILGKYGLSYRHRAKQEGKKLHVTCILSHRDGHCEETTLAADNDESGNKNSIQAIGSTATYLQRYTLKLALGLSAAKDDDANGAGHGVETISEKQIADLKALAEEVGANKDQFLKYFGIAQLADLPVSKYASAIAALNKKRNAK
jgi:hypothetical protein